MIVHKRKYFFLGSILIGFSILVLILFTVTPFTTTNYLTFEEKLIGLPPLIYSPNLYELIENIKQYNNVQPVLNKNRFGPLEKDDVVIVVQVHTRIEYLRHLIASLAQAKGISKTLLIFSHDYYDENINDLIRKIDFCKVLQIFYPLSIQTHEHEFPGQDPNDCPTDMKRDEAIKRKCNNAYYPDNRSRYRQPKFAQPKNHWWWKANRVFDQLNITKHHTGLVLLLEEDHYVAEDFLHVLNLMQNTAKEECPHCNIFTLAKHMRFLQEYELSKTDEVSIIPWQHDTNLGFAFNHETWREISKCANTFCNYDDYNWDYSLQYVSQQCLQKKLFTMIPNRARAFHIGKCGLHIHNNNCKPDGILSEIERLLKTRKESHLLYPASLKIVSNIKEISLLEGGNGWWGDIRDRNLCLNFTQTEV